MKHVRATKVSGRRWTFEQSVDAERSDLAHWALEKAIVDLSSADGLTPLTNKHVDLVVSRGATSVIFEVKACPPTRTGQRVRQAIYQLLEYRFLYRDVLNSDVRLCVVAERCPSGSLGWLLSYMEHLGIGMIWNDESIDALVCTDFTKNLLRDIVPRVIELPLPPTKGQRTYHC